jgi:hypothetical protein
MSQRLFKQSAGQATDVPDREWAIPEGGHQLDDFRNGDVDLRRFQESVHSAEVVSHCCAVPG